MKLNQTSVTRALQIVSSNNSKNLPGFATVNDIRDVVQFLKRHEEGVTIFQALDSVRKRTFDPRKLQAYDFWGVIIKTGDKIKLSDLGWEIARLRAHETDLFRKLLAQTRTYWSTLEWIQRQGLQVLSYLDLSSFWKGSALEGVPCASDAEIESSAGSFLQLCHAADLGMLLVGRKGQPTRLHIYPDELSAFMSGEALTDISPRDTKPPLRAAFKSSRQQRVFVSAAGRMDSVNRLLEMFTLAAVDHELAGTATGELTAIANNLEQMKQCDTGILIITREACDQKGKLSHETLIQLGAAVMHFKTRLMLLVEKGISFPKDIPVSHHTFDRDLSWELVIQMLSFVKQTDEQA